MTRRLAQSARLQRGPEGWFAEFYTEGVSTCTVQGSWDYVSEICRRLFAGTDPVALSRTLRAPVKRKAFAVVEGGVASPRGFAVSELVIIANDNGPPEKRTQPWWCEQIRIETRERAKERRDG